MKAMCGIAGIVRFDEQPIEPKHLWEFCDALGHRGPDDRGIWLGQMGRCPVGLAHTRLAVIDPSPAGHQPMAGPDQRCQVTYNGEIYNFRQIRQELEAQGAHFRSHSDTEVLLTAYQTWGTECFRRLDGMWAMCVIDARQGNGILVRDPFGIKPLYYVSSGSQLLFASEVTALLRVGGWDRQIDPTGLNHYLRLGFAPHPHTIFRAVGKLGPGQWLRFDQNGARQPEHYYRLQPEPTAKDDYPSACRQVRERLGQAVAARTVADVPIGAFLSGGLDSSIIVAHLCRSGARPVRTYTVGYAEAKRFDETRYARLVANRYGSEHHELLLTLDDVIEAIPKLLDHMGEPFGDSSLIPTALISQYTRQHVTVALSGDGGDELFAGYWRHRGLGYLDRYRHLPRFLRKGLVEPMIRQLPAGKGSWLADRVRQARKLLRAEHGRSGDAVDDYLRFCTILAPEAESILLPEARAALVWSDLKQSYKACRAADHRPSGDLDGILAADLRYGLANDMLCKVDLASMWCGLEVRVPMLDRQLVEYAMGLPVDYKLAGGRSKRVLADAHRDLLPAPIINRRKMGFEVPVGEFLRGRLRNLFLDVVGRDVIEQIGWLDHDRVMEVYRRHCSRRDDHGDLLYALLALCWWWRRWMAGS